MSKSRFLLGLCTIAFIYARRRKDGGSGTAEAERVKVSSEAWLARDVTDLELFHLHRDYLKHEDGLINNRVGWFIQLHSFLIASYGIVVAALINTFFPQDLPLVSPLWSQITAASLLFGVTAIGLESSRSAAQSINAAHAAVESLKLNWKAVQASRGHRSLLPGIVGGGSAEADLWGANFHLKLPMALSRLWYASLLVPLAFCTIALRGHVEWREARAAASKASTITVAPINAGDS